MTNKIVSKNPRTGEILRELDATQPGSLPEIFSRARYAQAQWAALSVRRRRDALLRLRETILNRLDTIIDLISLENGKPRFEAMSNELLPSVDLITYFAARSQRLLKDHPISLSILKYRSSYLNYWPLGVVAVISPWNYPFLLPFGEIVMALIAGNAVVFKPSEVTPLVGLKIQELVDEAGIPPYVLQTVIGDGSLGAAMIRQKPAKIFFTGSVATGKKIMAAAAEYLIPLNLELGGKDAMIVMPDADLDFASSAALWGGYSNSGQVCASVERLIVHESIADQFITLLKTKLGKLGPNDLGVITFDKQKDVYESQLNEAKEKGAIFITGGDFSADRTSLRPTLVTGSNIEDLTIYNEETFGPVIALTTFRSPHEAIEKTNKSRYGLLASVITKNITQGEWIARHLEVGTVTINEVTYTAGLAETPWGGVKDSGFGRKHSDQGLYEFTNVRHIHKPRSRFLLWKSPWWFPYSEHQLATFKHFFGLYRLHWIDKIKAIPHLLWNFIRLLKREKRL